jgi:hypothetical protein
MPHKKSLPKLSTSGSAIAEIISAADLREFNGLLCLDEEKLGSLAQQLNIALHEYRMDLERISAARQSRSSNRNTHYEKDILDAAAELVRRIESAPPFISSHSKFVGLIDRIEHMDEWIANIRTDPLSAELAAMDPHILTPRDRRLQFIIDAHDIYRHFTDRKDWVSRTHSRVPARDEQPNPFFLLVNKCVENAVGRKLSPSRIEKDIAEARKIYRAQKSRK